MKGNIHILNEYAKRNLQQTLILKKINDINEEISENMRIIIIKQK